MPPQRRAEPPYNPGLRELIAGKRKWSSPANPHEAVKPFPDWHERGYLPHRDEPGLTQFITFHLIDSLPTSKRSEWEFLLQIEDQRDRRLQLEAYLDKGRGGCHLRQPEIAKQVDIALRFYHSRWYELRAWVIMPNHVHFLIQVRKIPLATIIKELKRYTARQINQILKRRGAFWAADYFDTYMRNEEQELKTLRYIENNPVKAGLVREPGEWPWSSARFRDQDGRLCL